MTVWILAETNLFNEDELAQLVTVENNSIAVSEFCVSKKLVERFYCL